MKTKDLIVIKNMHCYRDLYSTSGQSCSGFDNSQAEVAGQKSASVKRQYHHGGILSGSQYYCCSIFILFLLTSAAVLVNAGDHNSSNNNNNSIPSRTVTVHAGDNVSLVCTTSGNVSNDSIFWVHHTQDAERIISGKDQSLNNFKREVNFMKVESWA